MENEYKGMTINERLYVSGLLEAYDKVVKEKNVDRIVEILNKIDAPKDAINSVLESLG